MSRCVTASSAAIVATAPAQSRASSRSTYFARTSTSRLTASTGHERAERRHRERVRDQRDREASSSSVRDREGDAVDRDRALLDAVAQELRAARRRRREHLAFGLDRPHRADAVDVALDECPPSGSPARSAGSRFTRDSGAEPRRASSGAASRERRGREAAAVDGLGREADAVDRDRAADLEPRGGDGASITSRTPSRRRRRPRPDPISRTMPVNMAKATARAVRPGLV